VRLDILAVMDRDPAVRTSPDVILYFKGFQALQTHRVSHYLWETGRQTLALFLQSLVLIYYRIHITKINFIYSFKKILKYLTLIVK